MTLTGLPLIVNLNATFAGVAPRGRVGEHAI
jgi:hypothetical protein